MMLQAGTPSNECGRGGGAMMKSQYWPLPQLPQRERPDKGVHPTEEVGAMLCRGALQVGIGVVYY